MKFSSRTIGTPPKSWPARTVLWLKQLGEEVLFAASRGNQKEDISGLRPAVYLQKTQQCTYKSILLPPAIIKNTFETQS